MVRDVVGLFICLLVFLLFVFLLACLPASLLAAAAAAVVVVVVVAVVIVVALFPFMDSFVAVVALLRLCSGFFVLNCDCCESSPKP